jgi:hypothetical protein
MAMRCEFSGFRDEADFRERFLFPLLHRLGFGIVVDYHGHREFGIDVLFAEIDRFCHVRYYGMQAKFTESIGKEAVHELIDACEEAFAMEINHPQTGEKLKISSFYAVTAGSISAAARDLFFAKLRPEHADNVRLLEGKDLLALDRSAVLSRSESVRELLTGLLIEIAHNEKVINQVSPHLEKITQSDGNNVQYPPFRLRLNAVSSYLQRPYLVERMPVAVMEHLWLVGTTFNRTLDEAGGSPLHTVVSIKVPAANALGLKSLLVADLQTTSQAVNAVMSQLEPLAPM